jgi:hypothetical protein
MAYKNYRVPLQKADGNWLVSDLYAAAFLHAVGHHVIGVENEVYDALSRTTFLFADSGVLSDDYQRFAAGEAIGVRKFLDSVYALKAILHNSPWRGRK